MGQAVYPFVDGCRIHDRFPRQRLLFLGRHQFLGNRTQHSTEGIFNLHPGNGSDHLCLCVDHFPLFSLKKDGQPFLIFQFFRYYAGKKLIFSG
jgi:hypothetical protein